MVKSISIKLSLTHTGEDKLTKDEISSDSEEIKKRLTREFKHDPKKLAALLQTVEELTEFELGRFLIKNKALSGYWTWYLIQGFKHQNITSPLEKFFVEKIPVVIATQQRFAIFQSLLMKYIKSNSVICSVPCGMMADLLTLNLPLTITDVHFVGIELDSAVFDLAKELAEQLNVRSSYEFLEKDAWNLKCENQFDIITSNGLNIYEKEDKRVVLLYKEMYRALKNNGYFICSALTPPPTLTQNCEWDIKQINQNDLATAATLLKTIIGVTWTNFRSSQQTCDQLHEAGFENIEIFWDKQRMFPTFLAQKR